MTVRTSRNEFAGGAAATTPTGSISSVATTFSVVSATNWPTGGANGNFVVVIGRTTATEEKILCSARSGTTFTVATGGRGYDGTAATSHTTVETVEHCIDANTFDTHETHMFDTSRDDHTQYTKKATLTTRGDIYAASGAATPARLAVGAANTVLATDGTDPSWRKIAAADITNDTITATQIAPNAITASELADGAVDTAAILDANVTLAKLATSSVDSSKIVDGTIVAADLAAALPLGNVVAPASVSAQQTIPNAAETDITGMTVTTPVLAAGRRLKITVIQHYFVNNPPIWTKFRIKEGATVLQTYHDLGSAIPLKTVHFFAIVTPTAAAHTYKVSIEITGGNVNNGVNTADATSPSLLVVEDIGV